MDEEDDLKDTKLILITWGFDTNSGNLYIDGYLEVLDRRKDVQCARMMELRQRFQNTTMSSLRVDNFVTREHIKEYIDGHKVNPDVLVKLKKSKIRLSDLLREPHELASVNFILDLDI